MGFPLYSLKTGIVACLSLLIISAMFLINLVMIRFAERDLVDATAIKGRLLIQSIGERVGHEIMKQGDPPGRSPLDPSFTKGIGQIIRDGGFSRAMVVGVDGSRMFEVGSWGNSARDARARCMHALRTQQSSLEFLGRIWGVIWFAPERLRMSSPIVFTGRTIGAVAIGADLDTLYQRLRTQENVVLGYICLNAILMVLFGVFLLSRTVIKPIRRLLAITEKFEEWPVLASVGESSRNEFGQLFRSLKMMLNRLNANKQELKEHIASLEKANLEVKKAQHDLIRSEKMATAGRLATGVAHEIGNPLGIILGYLELLKRGDLRRDEREDFMDRIEAEVNRIHQIIRELLDFSRHSGTDHGETAVHALITETVQMLEPQPMMEAIDVQQVFNAEDDVVRAGTPQLKQVFLNLIINAADAMVDEGVPSEDGAKKVLVIETRNRDGVMVVSFTDTGTGIPSEDRDRIFDPFFTTKAPGKGTGLGLAVCYNIIEGLGGTIWAERPAERGTRVTMEIPLAQSSASKNPGSESPALS